MLYWAIDQFTNIAFLDAMALCFFSVLGVMWLIARLKPLPQPVEFTVNTRLELETSPRAKRFALVVVVLTVIFYFVFSPLGIAG